MSGFKPLNDRVLVRRAVAEEMSPGGILIPDVAKEKPVMGTVVSVGSGRVEQSGETRPLEVKPGDRVLFGKYSGSEVDIEGVTHTILREDDILGIFT